MQRMPKQVISTFYSIYFYSGIRSIEHDHNFFLCFDSQENFLKGMPASISGTAVGLLLKAQGNLIGQILISSHLMPELILFKLLTQWIISHILSSFFIQWIMALFNTLISLIFSGNNWKPAERKKLVYLGNNEPFTAWSSHGSN